MSLYLFSHTWLSRITATLGYPLDRLPLSSLVMVEPPMMTPEIVKHGLETGSLPMIRAIEFAKTRRDIWSSREEAREWFAKQSPWKRWDKFAFDLFMVRWVIPSYRPPTFSTN